jgi:hypothetical protein
MQTQPVLLLLMRVLLTHALHPLNDYVYGYHDDDDDPLFDSLYIY